MCDGGRIQLRIAEGGEAFWKSVIISVTGEAVMVE